MDRDDLKWLLGPFPVRCLLDAVLMETTDCALCVRETIEYAVEADERVKKGDADQAYASELAERGYVVIAPDALAFEERNWSSPSGYADIA